jgi:outer membrane protein assembly factor BamA
LIVIGHAFAETGDDEIDPDRDFDLPGAEIAGLAGDGVDLEDVDFVGNPLKKLAERWPEDLVVAPIPGRSPQMGWTLTLGAGYFLESRKADSTSPPSVLGGFAMVAENGSYAYGGGANLHLLDDRLRVKVGAGYGDVRYRFYGIGNNANDLGIGIDILQEVPIYFASASWRVWNKLYIGLGYLGGDVESRLRITLPDPPPFFDPSLKLDIGAYTIPIEFDTRDHEQFPRKGWFVNGRTMLYRKSAGSDFDAETYKVSANHYRPMRDQDVLAFRAYVRATSGDAPFFLLSTFGGGTDLRGYPSGRYRDRMMYALQSEYRWQFSDRWIFTGFVGFGEVAENFGDFGRNFLPAAGIGARFVLSQKHRVGLSADIAVGNDGTEFYFGVGEAF